MDVLRQSSDFNLTEQIISENDNFPRVLLERSSNFTFSYTFLAVYWFFIICTATLLVFMALFTYITINAS